MLRNNYYRRFSGNTGRDYTLVWRKNMPSIIEMIIWMYDYMITWHKRKETHNMSNGEDGAKRNVVDWMLYIEKPDSNFPLNKVHC